MPSVGIEPQLYHVFLKTFARKEEVVAVQQELVEFREETREEFALVRTETREGFEQVDQRFEQLHAEMRQGFEEVYRRIDQLGARWGIRNELLFRETMITILEKSFAAKVETRDIEGEQFDLIITNGYHILVEIAASAPPHIVQRLQRKRELYARTTGVEPTRFVFAIASIHSCRAQALREAGFEVVEPEE
ncbi:MAG: DUF3782 domain-containing protein [Ardenticatenaceae bacterium]|nr:DUF3782 domain-containing protein [Ardenticatenaceae bacterium]